MHRRSKSLVILEAIGVRLATWLVHSKYPGSNAAALSDMLSHRSSPGSTPSSSHRLVRTMTRRVSKVAPSHNRLTLGSSSQQG